MDKEKLLLIINPISGARSKIKIPDLIKQNLDTTIFDYKIEYTQYAGHASILTSDAIRAGYKKIVAIGGDGTINEIAKVLVNTDCSLAIIPCGSGNGLSRHLKIPLDPLKAIKVINQNYVGVMDSGTINGKPFFCTAGVGFDAHIGKVFAESKTRGLNTYVKMAISHFLKYIPQNYSITINSEILKRKALLITFANSAQYGNNAFIAPQADIQDGWLDLCILKPFPKLYVIPFGISVFRKTAHQSKYLEIIRVKEVTVERASEGPIHVDGEPFEMDKVLTVKVNPLSLKIIIPKP